MDGITPALSVTFPRCTYNAFTRLYDAIVQLSGDESIAVDELDMDVALSDGTPLDNAWAIYLSGRGSTVQFRISAIVPEPYRLEDLSVSVILPDGTAWRLDHTASLEHETAGIIAVEVSDPDVQIDYWSCRADCRLQFGKKDAASAPVMVADPETSPSVFRAAASWPANRETITAIPAEGLGQKYTLFSSIAPQAHPSTARLQALKDTLAGQTAWIIGNGPSVRLEDLDRLGDAVTFCFNRFHLAYENTTLRPRFTISADQQMIEDFGDEILDRSSGTVFFAHSSPPSLTGDYLWLRQVPGFPSLFSKNAPYRVAPGGASAYVALQVAYYMGIRKFYFYGTDFKFTFDKNGDSKDRFRAATGDGNHFIKNYRSGKAWCPPSIQNILPSFYAARLLMEAEGGFIKNATRGGVLEVFERIDFDEALAAPA
ncbi:motility associated factor glycosyltransferase family protein [Acuticoccus mangrovi]|uniref:DUF115 domain-containing protein n=1 Tax=Acuticoccus mangrovi TaxID=2796142 RepID=A0A934IW10_9HYPH|nr:DUF115 domain-containing protein [Acuticoccus mangrovi]MBJ3778779.1 DUF115 domain-containing protein [Acuticoccus mangrovi]